MATETENQPWSIQRLLTWTTDYFQRNGQDTPRLAAEVLLAEALSVPRIQLYARFNDVPSEPHLGKFRDWVKRHAAGEPVAYLVGYREFYSLRFEVSPAVLIPRPETEQLVVEAIDLLQRHPSSEKKVVDVGTGSGCIAVTLAKQIPDVQVIAVDVSPEALAIAQRNAETHQVSERVAFIESDLLSEIPETQKFPLIVSNPPYVGRSEQGTLGESVKKYEPELALYGGDAGYELTEKLVHQAAARLLPGGWLVLETSPMLAGKIKDLILAHGAFRSCDVKKDLAKLERVLIAQLAD
ncbi:MAG: peptide chain release factor N(5)-glutamine methyltransferase [Pirellulaceae bacterium]|nr:peptide chain release factor N(5)-glutamine methyltransferase [Pirellulaceae bacterium]